MSEIEVTTRTFDCAVCGGTFDMVPEEEWSEEDRKKEREEIFGGPVEPTDGLCCHDCFRQLEIPSAI